MLPTDSAERLTDTGLQAAAISAALLMTQRSMSSMSPYFSAAGRNTPGAMI